MNGLRFAVGFFLLSLLVAASLPAPARAEAAQTEMRTLMARNSITR